MDLANLVQTLAVEGFTLGRVGCNAIEVTGPMPRLTPALRQALAEHKPTLLAMLSPEVDSEREAIQQEAEAPADAVAFPFGTNTRCVVHLDPTHWEEKPAANRPGWLRSTCKRCGTFIGYRPEMAK
ncbi:MAG: hypothetical protein ACYC6N_01215 [Pirellulaceae bacterium]